MRYQEENEKVQRRAGDSVVILLENWKSKIRRWRVYRKCLIAALVISCLALSGVIYYYIDSSIPSVIHIRADKEQSFRLGVPARGKIVSVNEQGASNIPKGAVDIDLSKTVTVRIPQKSGYKMQVNLFGFLPIKQVGIRVIDDKELIPVGKPIGIYVKTEGILVVGTGNFQGEGGITYSPGKNIVKSGDYIKKIDGKEISKKNELIDYVKRSKGETVTLTVERGGEEMDLKIKPKKDIEGDYKIGVWVRDSTQGVGTMTYIDEDGNFGALGHGISDVDTNTLMHMDGGFLYETEIINIKKGSVGKPGELTGVIVYAKEHQLAEITQNSSCGIFGTCNNKALAMGDEEPLPIGLKQEIKKGEAKILCTIDGKTKYYAVNITDIHLDNDNKNRGIELQVTDPELLNLTGGIVQGMSGSPIIQDDKIIGAVTHVLVNDSTRGYGIFIENMLEH